MTGLTSNLSSLISISDPVNFVTLVTLVVVSSPSSLQLQFGAQVFVYSLKSAPVQFVTTLVTLKNCLQIVNSLRDTRYATYDVQRWILEVFNPAYSSNLGGLHWSGLQASVQARSSNQYCKIEPFFT